MQKQSTKVTAYDRRLQTHTQTYIHYTAQPTCMGVTAAQMFVKPTTSLKKMVTCGGDSVILG